jgi:glycosyltransferase involved in cell wall biosynthesis
VNSLAVIILSYNEELHLERGLASVSPIASEVFVIDSYSNDRTVEIARAQGAHVLHNPWTNYAQQFQWALDNAPITADWVMRLDADEIIEPDLAAEIAAKLETLPPDVTGVNLKRKHIFMGRWIRHGGRYPLVLLRIWRRGKGRIEQRWMDEHMLLTEGRAVTFEGGFSDANLNDLGFFTDKHNKYATREAVDVLNQRHGLFGRDEDLGGASAQAARKRGAKEGFYNKLPFAVGPLAYFLYRYIFQLGFLDGKEGAIYHGLQGLWYRFLVDAKVLEFERELAKVEGAEAKLRRLAELTGLKLPSPGPMST